MEDLFKDVVYPDGTKPNLSDVDVLQRHFAEWFVQSDIIDQPSTFPVMTLALCTDKDNNVLDEEFFDWACKVNTVNGKFNIYVDGDLFKVEIKFFIKE